MLRKILLIGIMLVSVLIIFLALQRHRARRRQTEPPVADNETVTARLVEEGIKLIKYDKDNRAIAEVTGVQATQETERGPVSIVKPVIRILKDKRNVTVIRADSGRIEGRDQEKMEEGWLKGNVVLSVQNTETGDNTVVTCEEMQYHGSKGQIFIPGPMKVQARSLELSGSRMTADRGLGSARLESNVRLVLTEAVEGALEKLTGKQKKAEGEKGTRSGEHIVVTCEGGMVFDRRESRATFEKNVVATQGRDSVRGDSMIVEFESTGREPSGTAKPAGELMTLRRVIIRSERKDGVVARGP
ncbi:MAG: hypothetical protein AMS16_06560, partial [Planctomycetes bacterium DG_58]